MKTYIDECLERAEKATEGPWEAMFTFGSSDLPAAVEGPNRTLIVRIDEACSEQPSDDIRFIARARMDVPELARRLKKAIEALNSQEGQFGIKLFEKLIRELEAPIGDKK